MNPQIIDLAHVPSLIQAEVDSMTEEQHATMKLTRRMLQSFWQHNNPAIRMAFMVASMDAVGDFMNELHEKAVAGR